MPKLSVEDRMKEQKYLIQITEDCVKIAKELGWGSKSKSAWEEKNKELRDVVFHTLKDDGITPLKKAILKQFMEETKESKSTDKYDFSGKLKVKKDSLSSSDLEKFTNNLREATESG